ncbi:hypothetical protein FACS189488_07020 [Betaproteobacteria bacterium]|nr:hypothetical protein FACS189488_07020 [Betaproteobacteria bacterium]
MELRLHMRNHTPLPCASPTVHTGHILNARPGAMASSPSYDGEDAVAPKGRLPDPVVLH